jgi:transposase
LPEKCCALSISWLIKREDYQEPEIKKNKPKIPGCASPLSMMDIEEMIKTISQAGSLVKKELKEGILGGCTFLFS